MWRSFRLAAVVAASGTQYLGPLELLMNTLDWSLQNDKLLQIRSRGHFNRPLPSMPRKGQAIIDYANSGMAVILLLLIGALNGLRKRLRRRRYANRLAL